MRWVVALSLALFLGSLGSTALAADPIDVAVTKTDGTKIEGQLKLSTVKVKTEFGSAVVDADKVAEIRFGDPDVLVTTTEVELRGKVSLTSLRIETDDGRKTIRRADLAAIVRLEGGRPRGAADFSGEWMGTYGPMKLAQKGLTVTGTYGFGDDSSIEGKVKGRELSFEWRGPRARGSGTFELWEDGRVFLGRYTTSSGSNEQFWGAYRYEPRIPTPVPGEVVVGQAKSGVNFHLRAPKGYDPNDQDVTWPAIAFFHGSNMTSRAYVDTIVSRWPKLAADYVLVGIDGEKISSGSRPGAPVYNFTYVDYDGPEWGGPYNQRQSPALVAEALAELKEALPIRHWLVGGHSQGGFLTYAVVMFFPEQLVGAFPMSCNLLVQCEPDHSTHEQLRDAQRQVALALIHGQGDNVVDFSGGQYCYERMQDGGFPALRLFAPRIGHQFALLPVEEAVRWLEVMASGRAERLLAFAETSYREGEYRDALAALARAREAEDAREQKEGIEKLAAKLEAKAEGQAEKLERAIRKNENGRWADDFWTFRRHFALAEAAKGVLKAYGKLREEQARPANELFYEARNTRERAAKRQKWQELVETYYASKWYPLVKRWLE